MIDHLLLKLLPIERINRLRLAKASKNNLKAEFQDDEGRWWYSFRDEDDVSLGRMAMKHTQLQYLASGLSGDLFKSAMNNLTELLAKGEIVKMGVIVNDINELPKKVIILDTLINLIAVGYVREDEEPMGFSRDIHTEKCNWIMEQVETNGFFLNHPSWKHQLIRHGFTQSTFKSNLTASNEILRKLTQRWDILLSMSEERK